MICFQAHFLRSYLGVSPKLPWNATHCEQMVPKNQPRPRSMERCAGYFKLMEKGYTSSQYVQLMRDAERKGKEPRRIKAKRK